MEPVLNERIARNIFKVAPGVWGMRDVFVNYYMIQDDITADWVLVDAGLKWSAGKIKKMANYLFGPDNPPAAIILTHGHFDHRGALAKLAEDWKVPVYAHYMEIPYLTGKSSYPPPDPTVGGGMMAWMAWIYPNAPIDVWNRINVLPTDGTVPVLTEWRYIHTPGHAPGHISLFRKEDKVLIAGDAFVTTNQESAVSVIMQQKTLHGPPKYFTYDWKSAENSVLELALLQPRVAATGHGKPMRGDQLRDSLLALSQHFEKVAVPTQGRYKTEAAVTDSNGVVYLPEDNFNRKEFAIKVVGISALFVLTLIFSAKTKKKKKNIINSTLLDVEYNY